MKKMETQDALIPRSSFDYRCGGCCFSSGTFTELHQHLTEHCEGGNYYYHHSLKTAFPKHDLMCNGSQTCDDLSVTIATQTELLVYDVDIHRDLTFDNAEKSENERKDDTAFTSTNLFGLPAIQGYLNPDEDLFSIQPKKEVIDEIDKSTVDSVVVKQEVIIEDHEDIEPVFESSERYAASSEGSSGTDDYVDDDFESYHDSGQDIEPVLNKGPENTRTLRQKRKSTQTIIEKGGVRSSKRKKSSIDSKQNNRCVKKSAVNSSGKHYNGCVKKKVNKKGSFKEDRDLYKCSVCDREFACSKSLSHHIESKHYDTYPDKCQQCLLIFKNSDDASSHDCETARQFNHVCWQCPKPPCFRWIENIRAHLQDVHNGVLPNSCTYCNRKFVSEFDLNSHMTEHDPSLLNCPVCKKAMATYVNLKTHIKLHKRNHICERCGKCYTKRESFKHHVWACIGKFACQECNKTFCTNKRLKCHLLIHTGERPFMCEQCGQSFRSKEGLKSHIKFIHLGEKNFKCKACDKSFTNSNTLKRHERVHMNIRLYACEFCNKQCSTKWNLDAHMRQHNGKKPYSCNICGAAFAHNVARKNHEAKCTIKVNYSEESTEWVSGGNTLL